MRKLLALLLIALVACAHVVETADQMDEYEDPNLQFLGFLVPIIKVVGGFLVKKLALGKVAAFAGKAFAFGKKIFTGAKAFVKPLIAKFKGAKIVQHAQKIYSNFKKTKLFQTGKKLYDTYKPIYDKYKKVKKISNVVNNVKDVVNSIKEKRK